MKTLYIDGFAGISGDMFLGALIDAGADLAQIRTQLATMPLTGYQLTADGVMKNGIAATKIHITTEEQSRHRHLRDILQLVENSGLSFRVKAQSAKIFKVLAAAEAKVHGISAEQVHFHEVGAVDSIIDIIGSVIALEILGVTDISCSPLPPGAGFVQCAHGTIPLPAPATAELLAGVPLAPSTIVGETVTPTGAALVKTLSRQFGPLPPMIIERVGYGAGTADREIPNIVRVILGQTAPQEQNNRDSMWILETNIDDMNPEFFPFIIDKCLAIGAADVYVTPVLMKKGRPGYLLSVLCAETFINTLADVLLQETSSLGIRYYLVNRRKLHRELISADTCYGSIDIKIGRHPETGAVLNIAPEWECCKQAALTHNIALKTVYDAAKTAARQKITP